MFFDRKDAGQRLAKSLATYKRKPKTIVLGLPRGGVVVAAEVAFALELPLDIIVARKIGAPGSPELAIGAIAENVSIFDRKLIERLEVSETYIEKTVQAEKREAQRRTSLYRRNRAPLVISGFTVILVDDGIATGSTMRASIQAVKARGAKTIIVAVPVGAPETIFALQSEVDKLICLEKPSSFMAVGQFYQSFLPTEDQEVVELLHG